MRADIHIATAYSRKFKSYTVAAYVKESELFGLPKGDTFKTLCTYAIDGCEMEARKEAIARIYKNNTRHPADMAIIDHGRKPQSIVETWSY